MWIAGNKLPDPLHQVHLITMALKFLTALKLTDG
jgi:hypothetical protein